MKHTRGLFWVRFQKWTLSKCFYFHCIFLQRKTRDFSKMLFIINHYDYGLWEGKVQISSNPQVIISNAIKYASSEIIIRLINRSSHNCFDKQRTIFLIRNETKLFDISLSDIIFVIICRFEVSLA